MNRPERRNALNPALIAELTGEMIAAGEDARCRAVILTGAGNTFCAGMDMEHLAKVAEQREAEHLAEANALVRLMMTIRELPKPVIAVVNGAAIAGGTGLATICDFTLAAPEAKFGFTEVRIGFVPAIVSSALLRMAGEKQARELLLTGKIFSSEEALRLGLITWIVNPEQLMDEALALAGSLALNCPSSMAGVKRLLASFEQHQMEEEMRISVLANAAQRQHPDFKEGIRAFLMKRKPVWQRA
jgi:methylglutaconyl-CoA hydratase